MDRAILLAGGRGTRLYPMTSVASKQLMPIYNKPMVYYPLTTVMLAGARKVLLISTPEDIPRFESLLGDGSQWGIELSYATQAEPRGIAEALIIGREFIGDKSVMLMLGDNLIYGRLDFLRTAVDATNPDANIFAYQVRDPRAYGVVEIDDDGRAVSLEEKPQNPKSRWAVPGMYLYPPGVADEADALQPSGRGELEITDLNRRYLDSGRLRAQPMSRGIAWFDTGTPQSLLGASNFIEAVETRQDLIIGSPEEVSYRLGYVSAEHLDRHVQTLPKSAYREYLERLAQDELPGGARTDRAR